MLHRSTIPQTILLTVLFVIALFLLFPWEQPLRHTSHRHDHTGTTHITTNKTPPSDRQTDTGRNEIQDGKNENDTDPLDDVDLEQIFTAHASADEETVKARLQKLCTRYQDICVKVNRETDYDLDELYRYQILMIYLIKKIDDANQLDNTWTLRDTIQWIKMYEDDAARRWSAGASFVKMNTAKIDSYREFWEVFTHEVGWHILDIWAITDDFSSKLHPDYTEFGEPTFGLNDWSLKFYRISWLDEYTRRADATSDDFVSGYAMRDIFEELAEFANAWINHNALLREMAKTNTKIAQKVELFEELFGDWYILWDAQRLGVFDPTTRVFDTTKPWK